MGGSSDSTPLLPRVARGDGAAVEACLRRYGSLVLSMATAWVKDPGAAEDATQDVFVRLWRTADRFDPKRGSERTWVSMITRRVLIDAARSRGTAPPSETLVSEPATESESGYASAVASEESHAALAAIESLDPDRRDLIRLSLLEGLSHQEIAHRRGLPLGTVKTRLRRALEILRTRLADPGHEEVPS